MTDERPALRTYLINHNTPPSNLDHNERREWSDNPSSRWMLERISQNRLVIQMQKEMQK